MKLPRLLLLAIALPAALVFNARGDDDSRAGVDFERDIRPIFQTHCWKCHGPDRSESRLRLDSKPLAMNGGLSGSPIVAGKADASLIYQLITENDPDVRMPQKAARLPARSIELIRRWINNGAEWPESESAEIAEVAKHWAYIKPVRPEPPAVRQKEWVRTPIDAFVLAQLEKEGLAPSNEVTREKLIRRLSLDLIGLPPTLAEVDQFLADKSPTAYEKVVDRLLTSPHYGERWAQPWLDAARYADSNGCTNDRPRNIWPYRDWVINALNRDMPFDRFTIEQIAGDLLPNATREQQIATGFNRNTLFNDEQGVDQDEALWNARVDRVGTTATVWLGTTMACAECHNHKYDPFSQKEFYGLLACFESCDYSVKGAGYDKHYIEPQLDLADANQKKQRQVMEKEIADLKAKRKRTSKDDELLTQAKKELATFLLRYPATLVMEERPSKEPLTSYVRVKGSFQTKGDQVSAAAPAVLHKFPGGVPVNRLTLARWLISKENPLTARVTVNRAWSQFFGRGIVETEEDFGTRGLPPTHPELLDWLATEFTRLGWSQKKLHKTIVMSATYRQTSRITPQLLERDPYNLLLARGPRYRLSAEQIRDVTLAASGLLSGEIGGPSVFPPQPETTSIGDHGDVSWPESTGEDRYRRGIYTFWRRSALYPALSNLDAPSREACAVKRVRTNTPLQALTLLNDTTACEAAAALARRIQAQAPSTATTDRAAFGFRLCTGRIPSANETDALVQFHAEKQKQFEQDKKSTQAISSFAKVESVDADFAAWFLVSQALLNLDATLCKE